MKKLVPTILIALIIVNLFAPFSVGLNRNRTPVIKKSTAEAAFIEMTAKQNAGATNTSIPITFTITRREATANHGMVFLITDTSGTRLQNTIFTNNDGDETSAGNLRTRVSTAYHQGTTQKVLFTPAAGSKVIADMSVDFADMDEIDNTGLALSYTTTITKDLVAGKSYYLSYAAYGGTQDDAVTNPPELDFMLSTTRAPGEISTEETTGGTISGGGTLPACWLGITKGISMSGCIAQLIYYLLFVPTSYLFALTGVFFDSTFAYSVNDESYRSPFVVEGWGLVRDFVNMFFIFVLLYIAFSTILAVHGFKTKEMIVNVIIIGLLMNFSLFAGQLIIDSSNILARVFYNSDAIKITKGGVGGVSNNTPGADVGPNGELPLSAALVNKVNPQNLIINASNVGTIPDKGGRSDPNEVDKKTNVSNGTFILILLLSVAVNVIGMIVFLSVGLIFVARVVGLWIYMILAPFAFFSYTVPSMQSFTMVGWKKWWPEVLSLAFVAPIFIFFLYLILKFLETGLSLISAGGKSGLEFLISVVVPFAFIMILLWKAKGIAQKMSGELGQTITGGVAAIGGLALGGAALGAAAIGRGTIGAFMKGASTGDTSASRLAAGTSTGRIDRWKGRLQTYTGVHAAQQAVGGRLNRDQSRVEGYAHARKTLDDNAQARYHKKYSELTQTERTNVQDTIDRDIVARQQFGNKKYSQLNNAQQAIVNTSMATQRAAPGGIAHGAADTVRDARGKQGLVSSVIQSTRNGSFDVRNLSKVVANEYDRGFNKMMTGITAGLAGGMRSALKQSNVNYGTGQKDVFKDLGNTISDALKSATIKVDLSHVGEEHKEDHGGGHH